MTRGRIECEVQEWTSGGSAIPEGGGRFLNRAPEDSSEQVDGDPLNLFGFDVLDRRGNLLDVCPSPPKHQIFELCGPREAKQRCPRHPHFRERRYWPVAETGGNALRA